MCKSYSTASGFRGMLNKYARDLMNGKIFVTLNGTIYSDVSKCLELAFPNVPLTTVQKQVLEGFIKDNADNFEVIITIIE